MSSDPALSAQQAVLYRTIFNELGLSKPQK